MNRFQSEDPFAPLLTIRLLANHFYLTMSIYKRGNVWYKFVWNGEQIRASTKTSNKRVAEQIESARKTSLAKGEAGIQDIRPSPSFREFTVRFLSWVQREKKPSTIKFYNDMVRILLRHKPLAATKLNKVDRDLIANIQNIVAPATRRALYEDTIELKIPRWTVLYPQQRSIMRSARSVEF